MPYIPLKQHKRPRIFMLDFSSQAVAKVQQAGFEALQGASGLHDNNKYFFPFAVQDVEVVVANVMAGSFIREERSASTDSVEQGFFFKALLRETWSKAGWIILFISQDTSPQELEEVGLACLGVISQDDHLHVPGSIRDQHRNAAREYYGQTGEQIPELPPAQIPRFTGEGVHTTDEEPLKTIIERFTKPPSSARMSILTCGNIPPYARGRGFPYSPQPHVLVFNMEEKKVDLLIQDDSTDQNILALRLDNDVYAGQDANKQPIYNRGGILLLPDFEQNNVNVALALLQEFITKRSPYLFDEPEHSWLEKYQSAPVVRLLEEKEALIADVIQKLQVLDERVEKERENYAWLLGLLVLQGDQFAADVATALRFLGFDVEEVDNTLAPGERRREDLHVCDKTTGYFALGEAKTTGKGRGASEDFITKMQTHQARYARENHQEPPPALLVVNFAIDVDPLQRIGRFYQAEVSGRLQENGITALNSVALFDLCQFVLRKECSKEQVQRFLTQGQPLIAAVTVAEVIQTSNEPS